MPERRFTEEEARRIFAAVADRQKHTAPGPDGLTLAELQEVARASGLDPALVAAVAAEREAPEAAGEVAHVMGLPAEVRRARVLPVAVTDAAWERIVADLRATFKTPGNPSQIGRVREWTGSGAYGGSVRVAVEPLAQGARVVASDSQVEQGKVGLWMGVGLLAFALVSALIIAVRGADPDLWGMVATFTAIAALSAGGTWAGLRIWAPRKARQFDALLDRADLIARDETAPLAPEATAPRLGLDALPDAPDASGDARTRTRERS